MALLHPGGRKPHPNWLVEIRNKRCTGASRVATHGQFAPWNTPNTAMKSGTRGCLPRSVIRGMAEEYGLLHRTITLSRAIWAAAHGLT